MADHLSYQVLIDPVDALATIWNGQEPPFEVRWASDMSSPVRVETPAEALDIGADYFGIVGRLTDVAGTSMGKAATAPTGNVIWLDMDAPAEVVEEEALLMRAVQRLEMCRLWGIEPSVQIFSGHGCWLYWKLDHHLPAAEIEMLNRRLFRQFERVIENKGGGEWNIDRIARLPGSVNRKTRLHARVLWLSDVVWGVEELDRLIERESQDDSDHHLGAIPDVRPGSDVPSLSLSPALASYVRDKPTKADRVRRSIDGSAKEQAIVCHLVNKGCSDAEIAAYFDHHRLPRHMAERSRSRQGSEYRWLALGIANARARSSSKDITSPSSSLASTRPPTSDSSVSNGNVSDHDDGVGKKRPLGWENRRWHILKDIVRGQTTKEFISEVSKVWDIGKREAYRDLAFLKAEGVIDKVKVGRTVRITVSDKGHAVLTPRISRWWPNGLAQPPLSWRLGMPSESAVTQTAAGTLPTVAQPRTGKETKVKGKSKSAAATREVSSVRQEELARERQMINGVHRLSFLGKRRIFHFMLAPEQPRPFPSALLHEQLITGHDGGLPVFESLVSTSDSTYGDDRTSDPVTEYIQKTQVPTHSPKIRTFAYAAEVVLNGKQFELAVRDENGASIPNFGLIVQAEFNFFQRLKSTARKDDTVVKAVRHGSGKDRRFDFEYYTADLIIEFPPLDIDALLSSWCSHARAVELVTAASTADPPMTFIDQTIADAINFRQSISRY